MTTSILGLDPGASGGAVLLSPDGRRVLAAWAWSQCQRELADAWLLQTTLHGRVRELQDLAEVGEEIAADLRQGYRLPERYQLVVERLFLPSFPSTEPLEREAIRRHLGRCASVLQLAESAALVFGPLLRCAERLHRVYASRWRAAVLDLQPGVDGDEAEDKAIERCREGLVVGLGALVTNGHVAEAACMARWQWEIENPAQQSLLGGTF